MGKNARHEYFWKRKKETRFSRKTNYSRSTKSTFNALTFFRLGLGDNDSSGYTDGNIATKVTADLDSAIANLDTWAHASYRGAKYYVSVNNTTTNEVMNAELLIVHNGSDAFIQDYNIIATNSGNTPLATFTADISGSDVRLLVTNISDNSTVFKFQRTVINV